MGSRASDVLFAAAAKAAELATIEREIKQATERLSDPEVELAAIHRDCSGDD